MCGVVTGAFATLKALSGHEFKLAFVEHLVSAVSGMGRAADGDIGGGLGLHGDQFRQF